MLIPEGIGLARGIRYQPPGGEITPGVFDKHFDVGRI